MKIKIIFIVLSAFCINKSVGQTVFGKVVDSATGEALEYVNIGVIGEPRGTITDKSGDYQLEISGLTAEVSVRISMIGYAAQTITIKSLSDNNGMTVRLESAPVILSEVVVRPGKLPKPRKVGTTGCSAGSVCGWGGTFHGKGNEIGTKIEIGETPVQVKSLHFRLYKQSYDTCFLRLHVRNIVNDLPGDELLSQHIIFPITTESGWVVIDLSEYHLELQGDVILSIEWVDYRGINERRFERVKSNGKKLPPYAVLLFRIQKNKGSTYTRWGSEAKWGKSEDASPSFYLTVL